MDYFYSMLFKKIPVYNASNESESRVINLELIEEIKPHADVPVDPGAVNTSCCEVRFFSGTAIIVLISQSTFESQLTALTGQIDELGELL